MAKGIPSFQHLRLTQAREARGLTGVNLATIVGVSAATISQYEHEVAKPPAEILDKLAKALNVQSTFFLRPVGDYDKPKFFYRSMSAATKGARTRAERRFEWLRETTAYFESHFDLPQVNLPEILLPESFKSFTDEIIDECADRCRKHFHLSAGPIPNVVRTLEKAGIVVSRMGLEADTLDAFSESDSWSRPFIVLGSEKECCVRSRFDAAHELGHLVLHLNVEKRSLLTTQDHALIEQQAHRFATVFLLPEADFIKDLVVPTLESFAALKERWRVSIAAMLKRCTQLGLLNEPQAEKLWINIGRRGWRKKEPFDDRLPVEQPKLLRQCVDMMVKANFSRSQIADEIGLPVADVEELASLPSGYLNDGFGEIVTVQFKSDSPHASIPSEPGEVIPFVG